MRNIKVRKRILLLASLLLLVSVGGIVNLVSQFSLIEQIQDPKTILQILILLGLFGTGLAFSILELFRQEIRSPIIHLTTQISRLKKREIDGHRLELIGNRDIDLLSRALNDLLDGYEKEEFPYRIFTEASPDMIFLLDEEGCVLFGNHNAARQWNYQPGEIIGKRQEELFSPDIAERHKQVIKTIFETGHPVATDVHEMIGKRHRWIDVRMIPVLDKDGLITAILGISRDITERKQAEEALIKSEIKYKTLIHNLPQKIFLKDKNSVFLSCNDNYARDLKIKPEEIVGKTDFDFYPKELAEKHRSDDKRIMESREIKEFEGKYIQGGNEIIVQTVKSPIQDEQGNITGILGIFWDITERKKTEDELHQRREELFHMQRFKSMGELASSLAHEINQPLMGIMSNAQAAQKFLAGSAPDLDEIRKILADIVADDKRAGEIIHRLRALLRKEEVPRESLDINSSVRNMMTLVRDEAIVRNVSLHSEMAEGLPQVFGDKVQIEQVILNLIMNAEQAMEDIPAHKRNIVISTVLDPPNGVLALLSQG